MSTVITPWIINRRQDLTWFIGSALLGYVLLAVAVPRGGLPGAFLILFAFAIDGPHVFSTLTRSLFDADERSKLHRLWLVGFPFCVVGIFVAAMLAGSDAAFVGVVVLAYYHISKQHMGFVMLYKRKAGERDDFKIDKYFTLASLLLPLAYYLSALLTARRISIAVFLVPGILTALWYARHQAQKETINKPKIILLAAFIPLQWLAWSFAATDPHSMVRLVAAGVAINVGHSLQYLRLMYFHNQNRYSKRAGLLGFMSRRPVYFCAAIMILAIPNLVSIQTNLKYLSALVVGMFLFHFVLDAKIWRIRGNVELARALNL